MALCQAGLGCGLFVSFCLALQDALLETWSSEADDWDVEELSDSQLIDILYEVRCCKTAGRDL